MGWYTNYEVIFDEFVDWDDFTVQKALKSYNVQAIYLRDMDDCRIILCVYSQNPIEQILAVLKDLYLTDMRYKVYGT